MELNTVYGKSTWWSESESENEMAWPEEYHCKAMKPLSLAENTVTFRVLYFKLQRPNFHNRQNLNLLLRNRIQPNHQTSALNQGRQFHAYCGTRMRLRVGHGGLPPREFPTRTCLLNGPFTRCAASPFDAHQVTEWFSLWG